MDVIGVLKHVGTCVSNNRFGCSDRLGMHRESVQASPFRRKAESEAWLQNDFDFSCRIHGMILRCLAICIYITTTTIGAKLY